MKIDFLYKDDTYKTVIEDIKESLGLEENKIIYTPVVQAGMNIFSFYKYGDNEETAKILDGIKNLVSESLSSEKFFIITDEISFYFCQRLYPLLASFERGLRKILYISSLKSNDENIIKRCHKIEELDFAGIYEMLFSDTDYVNKAKNIVNSKSPVYSKHDILRKLTSISESTLWDKLFKGNYSYISENFLDIKNGRNKVMHSRGISYVEFSTNINRLTKSNKMLNDIEMELLEKDNYDYNEILNTITSSLTELGQAMVGLVRTEKAINFLKKLGEIAVEGMEDDFELEVTTETPFKTDNTETEENNSIE